MDGHVTSRKTCVVGLIPIWTTLTGGVIKAVLEVPIQVHVWMQIKVLVVIIAIFRAVNNDYSCNFLARLFFFLQFLSF